MANVDTNEEFWGITLSKEKKTHTWNPAATEEDVEHKIQVTQACLGLKAKEGERNVVEVCVGLVFSIIYCPFSLEISTG